MSIVLSHDNYGKSRVRLVKVNRNSSAQHEIKDLNINIQFEGDFASAHIVGDNGKILPTDTMKNTVYALARQTDIVDIETFSELLVQHFLSNNLQVSRVVTEISERLWGRIKVDGKAHPRAFMHCMTERRTSRIEATREKRIIQSGLEDLLVLKTTNSGFSGFIKDKYTTLKETDDRIFATAVKARWFYRDGWTDFGESWRAVRNLLVETFAAHDSLSVQHTLYAIGQAVLEAREEITEISLSMPNKHCLPVDLSPFGLDNPNEVFMPIDEPHGLIEGTIRREGEKGSRGVGE
jgi:urate oxidase